ncbi:CFC_HP_G0102270.mRNA.1.CDS.1 [Saccharomyces cerevisiae]|nr:CFC_HP_G0102270.mRNA.1.CDS.1 [Saccharomyces cerevisiae]CAI6903822.1 CFC_HP_G0102270.mRNA.1.CDS.1 [Saccharomyces cerevisiae]
MTAIMVTPSTPAKAHRWHPDTTYFPLNTPKETPWTHFPFRQKVKPNASISNGTSLRQIFLFETNKSTQHQQQQKPFRGRSSHHTLPLRSLAALSSDLTESGALLDRRRRSPIQS